jgi:outer membrane cobalamin receptor
MLKMRWKKQVGFPVLCCTIWMASLAGATEVVVVASRTQQDSRDVAASVTTLDAEQISLLRPISIDELFRTVPGVDLQGSGFPGSDISLHMRGLTAGRQTKRVLVLVDGRRLHESFEGNAELALLPADSIERVEILRGPASALYGSNAMGGVINIITRRGAVDPVTDLGILGGSYNTYNVRLGHGARHEELDYFVNGSLVDTDGYMDNADGTDRDWAAVNLTANVGYTFDEQSEVRFFTGFYDASGTGSSGGREVQRDYEALEYRLLWDEKRDARLVARAYRNAQDDVYAWNRPGTGFYELETLGAELQQSFWISSRQNVTAGLELRDERADVTEITGPIDESSSVLGAYIQDEVHIGDDVILSVGVRVDRSADYATETSPRVGKGSAATLTAHKAKVIITEIDPICALQAAMAGFQVSTVEDALPVGDIFVTATGCCNVITAEHMAGMKDQAIVCKFADRCAGAQDACRKKEPQLTNHAGTAKRRVRCFFPCGQESE